MECWTTKKSQKQDSFAIPHPCDSAVAALELIVFEHGQQGIFLRCHLRRGDANNSESSQSCMLPWWQRPQESLK
jgi:hypothetical protein